MSKMDSVVHFEMPYDDRERMAKFYRAAFGWQTRMLGEEVGNYVIATTTETDESGPKKPGAINGGFFARKPDWQFGRGSEPWSRAALGPARTEYRPCR
jgi:predicted enzyme related to lactoylglutathione lyase